LYLAFADGGGIWRIRKDAPAPPEQIIDGDIWTITADESFGYFGDHATGDVFRWTK